MEGGPAGKLPFGPLARERSVGNPMSGTLISARFPAPPPRQSLFGLTRARLGEVLQERGFPRYRADQIYGWIYHKHHRQPERMTNLPAPLRLGLLDACDMELPRVTRLLTTPDQLTHKFVLELADGARVECVSMRTERRLTLCLSTIRVVCFLTILRSRLTIFSWT